MKKVYMKPDAEYITLMINSAIAADYEDNEGTPTVSGGVDDDDLGYV